MKTSSSCLIWLVVVVTMPTIIQSQLKEQHTLNLWLNRPAKNLELHDNNVIIGSKNRILVLDETFGQVGHYNTCLPESKTCNNVNKVMVLNEDLKQLLICGTGKEGKCEILSVPLLNVTLSTVNSDAQISKDGNRPVVGVLSSDNDLTLAMTNANGVNYPISVREWSNLRAIKFMKFNDDPDFSNFEIYYKDVFQIGNYSYFVTNQEKQGTNGKKNMISKVARVCSQDSDKLHGYIDFEIGCQDLSGTDYNLIQHVEFLELPNSNSWVIGVFTKGHNPEQMSGDSVICASQLNDVITTVNNTWEDFRLCEDRKSMPARYFADNRGSSFKCNSSQIHSNDYLGCKNTLATFGYNIGVRKLEMKFGYKVDHSRGDVTAVSLAHMSHAHSPVLLVGTSKGKLIQTNIHVNGDRLHLSEYSNHSLSNPYPVSAIRQKGDDTVYVLTEAKIHKLASTDCSEFTSCQSTMDGKNPLCGWCVLENKATRYGKGCGTSDNDWLSALDGTCLAFTPSPAAVSVGSFESVTITVSHTLSIPTDATKQCVFRSDDFDKPSYTVDASFTSDTFTCQAPNVKVHTQASLDIVVKGFVLGTTSLMFFECGQFTTCGSCVMSTGNECSWDTSSLTCQNSNAGTTSTDSCPKLQFSQNYVPSGKGVDILLMGTNLQNTYTYKCMVGDQCFDATVTDNNKVTCTAVNLQTNRNTTTKKITVKYGTQSSAECSNMVSVDDPNDSTVTVYNCTQLADGDCSICCALNPSRYKCNWANDQCSHDAINPQCQNNNNCPAPVIDRLDPMDGPIHGGTLLTLTGKNFGHWNDDTINMLDTADAIKMGGKKCFPSSDKNEYKVEGHPDPDYSKSFPTRIVFPTDGSSGEQNVTLKLNSKESNPVFFVYKLPVVTNIIPNKGPIAGGTKITLVGDNLSIGNKRVKVVMDSQFECTDAKAIFVHGVGSNITCTTQSVDPINLGVKRVDVFVDNLSSKFYQFDDKFTYVDNPVVGSIEPLKGTLSGGTMLTVTGENLNNAHNIRLGFSESADNNAGEPGCSINSSSEVFCPVPRVKDREAIEEVLNGNRRKRSVDSTGNCLEIPLTLTLDGVQHMFTISYCRDPELKKFDNGVLLYESDDKYITIKGEFLTLVAKDSDFHITVGVGECKIIELKSTEITCHPPEESPADTEVRVVMGNIDVSLGRLEYAKDMQWMMIIIAVAAAAVAVLIVIIIVFVCYKLKLKKQAKKYEDDLKGMEMEIIDVARQEFLDMHTTMSTVNRNLVEQGFPYRDYQQYACNVMFAVDYLWTEPVMTDDERIRANKGMEALESLIYNKYFLVSVIGTMEKQKKFFIREKSNLAGNLCSVLMGKMDYLNEVLCMLIKNLVQDSSGKKAQQKALFRRCESITEKLLSNWMSLCLYPHFKNHSGSPLYLLYVALLKTVEAGPIDAITNDSKYTLSEEKLLKKFSSSVSEESLKFESKTLTLNVVVNEGEEIFKCKVLDCDTISQVKCKCLSQIYVNYPASKLDIDPDELILEWHEGFSGSLRLQDHDNTSAQEGVWVRLNTLAHYNVKDESNLALVDPHSAEVMQQEDYVNLTNVNVEFGGCNGSMDSTDPLTSTSETQEGLEYWHLVKKEEEHLKKEKPAIDSLYLNRLITTKLSLKDYINTMFHAILDKDKVPPPTKFLLDYLDDLGEQFKVDNDTIHGWKSHSYAIRIWAALIKMPSLLFDVNIPTYIEQNLSVISQVFIESFSLSSQKFTKDSPSQKLIFHNEMLDCRERALGFYKNVKCDTQNHEELRQSLMEVNKLQQQTNINKTSALYRFYQQMKPYLEDIVEDLATSKETGDLQLDKKLEKVMSIMEEEEDE